MVERKTDRLRRLLDERGAEHYDNLDATEWVGADGDEYEEMTYSVRPDGYCA